MAVQGKGGVESILTKVEEREEHLETLIQGREITITSKLLSRAKRRLSFRACGFPVTTELHVICKKKLQFIHSVNGDG